MTPTLLVLGGSGFVGRALVGEGLARGWTVTTFNRGRRGWAPAGAERLVGDRLRPETLEVLGGRDWDVVADTWSGAPRAVRDSAALLAGRTRRYAYVSSASVYRPPPPVGGDEASATVPASPDAEDGSYPERKRGSELAATAALGERALLVRSGLVLGPHEDVGRLPWWLRRIAAGGEVLAPGPHELPLQYVDARDLAAFVLDAATAGRSGPLNVGSWRGHATMGTLLDACRSAVGGDARLTWVDPEVIAEHGLEPWTELPVWLPPDAEYAGLHHMAVDAAHAAGLHCRPVRETVGDTWAWLRSLDGPPRLRPDLPPPGYDRDRERAVLAAWHARAHGWPARSQHRPDPSHLGRDGA